MRIALIGSKSGILKILGLSSMAILVLHTIVSSAIRLGLSMIPWLNTGILQLMLCVPAGLALPVVIYRWAARYGLARLFALGDNRKLPGNSPGPAKA